MWALIVVLVGFLSSGEAELNLVDKQLLLDFINIARARVCNGLEPQLKCSNVVAMQWNDRLAEQAQERANSCEFEPEDLERVGQTQYYGRVSLMDGPPHNWLKENEFYDPDTDMCQQGQRCSNFTQLLQWDSVSVGCGHRGDCSGLSNHLLVCNFAPMGNRGGKPYIEGEICSNCPEGYRFCMNGLCASEEQCEGQDCFCALNKDSCEDGGSFHKDSCSCMCRDESADSTCTAPCEDNADFCTEELCSPSHALYIDAIENCKKTCQLCNKIAVSDDFEVENKDGLITRVPVYEELTKMLVDDDDLITEESDEEQTYQEWLREAMKVIKKPKEGTVDYDFIK